MIQQERSHYREYESGVGLLPACHLNSVRGREPFLRKIKRRGQ